MDSVVQQVLILMITHLIISSILVFVIHPLMTYRKLKKEGLTVNDVVHKVKLEVTDPIVSKIDSKITMVDTTINERINDMNVHVANIKKDIGNIVIPEMPEIPPYPEMPVIPDNIPDMAQITTLIEDGRANTVKVLEEVQLRLSKNMQAVNDNIPIHIASGIKTMEGRLYRAKGIVQHDHEKGIDAAKEVILHGMEDPEDKTPIMQIVRHFVKVAADAELIDPENADQKIGLVQGILEGVKMFQDRGNSNMGGSVFMSSPRHSSLPSHGDGLDGYYR